MASIEYDKLKAEYKGLEITLDELPKKLTHPIMMPINEVAFVPAQIRRSNEILVYLGCNLFVWRTVSQAKEILQRRQAALENQKRQFNDSSKSSVVEMSENKGHQKEKEMGGSLRTELLKEYDEYRKSTVEIREPVDEYSAKSTTKSATNEKMGKAEGNAFVDYTDEEWQKKLELFDQLEIQEKRSSDTGSAKVLESATSPGMTGTALKQVVNTESVNDIPSNSSFTGIIQEHGNTSVSPPSPPSTHDEKPTKKVSLFKMKRMQQRKKGINDK